MDINHFFFLCRCLVPSPFLLAMPLEIFYSRYWAYDDMEEMVSVENLLCCMYGEKSMPAISVRK